MASVAFREFFEAKFCSHSTTPMGNLSLSVLPNDTHERVNLEKGNETVFITQNKVSTIHPILQASLILS
jgi:hypothetical protein